VEIPDSANDEEILGDAQTIPQQESGGGGVHAHESPGSSSVAPDQIRVSMPQVSQRVLLRKAGSKRPMTSRYSTPLVSGKRPRNSSVSRSTEAMVIEEVQGLRQEVRGVNRNLEKLVDVQNRLNDTFERFLTAIRLRM